MDYTARTAEAAVQSGEAPAALIIPAGFGAHPMPSAPARERPTFQILHDSADPVAAQVVAGMLQKTVMTAMPGTMASMGSKYFERSKSAGSRREQRKQMDPKTSQFQLN